MLISGPLQIEMSHSAGRGDRAATFRLIKAGTQISWLLFVGVCGFLMVAGPLVFRLWTGGQVVFSYPLMLLFLLMSACNLTGKMSYQGLVSMNRMYGPSFIMSACSVLAVALGGYLCIPFGIAGMVLGGVAGEAMNSAVVIGSISRWLDVSIGEFFRSLIQFGSTLASLRDFRVRAFARLRRGT